MKRRKKKKSCPCIVKTIKKIARQARLDREKLVGRPRAKTFGGKPTVRQDRRTSKSGLRRLDGGES